MTDNYNRILAIPQNISASNIRQISLGVFSLTNVIIPFHIHTIQPDEYKDCTSLTEVTFSPDNCSRLLKIGSGAFRGCTGLKTISIPTSVTSFGEECFVGCSGLTLISIPDCVPPISQSAFTGCDGLIAAAKERGYDTVYEFGRFIHLNYVINSKIQPTLE